MTVVLPEDRDAIAPDGSEVRLLAGATRGGMAHFLLPAGQVSRAVAHRSVEELWFVLDGEGEMWLQPPGRHGECVDLRPGASLFVPSGVAFQFRAGYAAPLTVVAVTMPPWPGPAEAEPRDGYWQPTV
jgi:mannose-6-phosphate isomerase-like protein (cupin superfamily)